MKRTQPSKWALFLFMSAAIMSSCSKDDGPSAPQEENTAAFEPLLFEEDLELPSTLVSNPDPKAQELVYEFETMTSYMEDSDIMEVPPGAVVSHEPVQTGTPDGRPGASPNYTVYTYTSNGTTIVYQFSVQNGYDVFEMFFDIQNDNLGMAKFYEIKQSLDDTHGSMSWFIGQQEPLFLWTWQINADDSIFLTMDYTAAVHYEMMIYPDNSGHLEIYNENARYMEFLWNGNGSGSWTNHQSGESGSWN